MNLPALAGAVLLAFTQSGDPRTTAREILADPAYQVDLPGEGEGEQGAGGGGKTTGGGGGPERTRAERERTPVDGLTELLMWGGLVVGVVLAAAWLAQLFGGYGNARIPAGAAPPPSPVSLGTRILADAEALAAQGRFAEAIHVLLLRVFEALSSGGSNLEPCATSREIVDGLELDRARQSALAGLVAEVEHSLFGGRAPDRSDYESCLRSFEVLAGAGRGAAGP